MFTSWRTTISGLVLISLLVVGFFVVWKIPKRESFAAGVSLPGVKLSGFAWSPNLGWISFSCSNIIGGCQNIDYGVSVVRPAGGFSGAWETLDGYAWANPKDRLAPTDNVGWITFSSSGLVNCPSDPGANLDTTCKAEINFSTGEVRGWARACSVFQNGCSGALKADSATGGWDGWIELAGTNHVSPVMSGLQGVTLDKNNCSLKGFASQGNNNDNSQFGGWIKFQNTHGVDPGPDYGVSIINLPPNQPKNLVLNPDYCAYPWNFSFQWLYTDPEDDAQGYYQIQISTDNSFAGIPNYDTGETPLVGDANKDIYVHLQFCSPSKKVDFPGSCQTLGKPNIFEFDKNYFWRVRTWNGDGLSCAASQFSPWSANGTFHTPKHDYPATSYTYSPPKPSAGETVTFTNGTKFDTGSQNQSYKWDFGDGVTKNATPPPAPVTHAYTKKGTFSSSLTATDDLKDCSTSQPDINVYPPLPTFKEKPPTQQP